MTPIVLPPLRTPTEFSGGPSGIRLPPIASLATPRHGTFVAGGGPEDAQDVLRRLRESEDDDSVAVDGQDEWTSSQTRLVLFQAPI
jgi:hypothetical protein